MVGFIVTVGMIVIIDIIAIIDFVDIVDIIDITDIVNIVEIADIAVEPSAWFGAKSKFPFDQVALPVALTKTAIGFRVA
jgi:hypothetical protein